MKIKYLFLLVILTSFFAGCKDSDSENLQFELSESAFNDVSYEGATLEVQITSGAAWVASSNVTWCTFVPTNGTGNQKCIIEVQGNLETTARTATVTIKSGKTEKSIEIHQNASEGELHYKLPVIFHVLYQNESDAMQYVSQSRLADILTVVNKLYNSNAKSVDMNLSFTLATSDPDGNLLATPGVEYVRWTGDYPIDCDEFMNDESGKYVPYIWEPNQYINVMIYNFKPESGSNMTTLGIAHIPFSTKGDNYLDGLAETSHSYLEKKNLKFAYGVSVNSLYINDQSSETEYSTADVTVTLAHELGHYLGLHHAFSEDENGTTDDCIDSDYCDDTPTYNKVKYDEDYFYIANNEPSKFTFEYLVLRTNCSGTTFTSRNIMDYAVSYSDRFTDNQRDRIRHVLTYSPLIPGPKKGQTKTRAAEGPLDLPIRVVK